MNITRGVNGFLIGTLVNTAVLGPIFKQGYKKLGDEKKTIIPITLLQLGLIPFLSDDPLLEGITIATLVTSCCLGTILGALSEIHETTERAKLKNKNWTTLSNIQRNTVEKLTEQHWKNLAVEKTTEVLRPIFFTGIGIAILGRLLFSPPVGLLFGAISTYGREKNIDNSIGLTNEFDRLCQDEIDKEKESLSQTSSDESFSPQNT